MAATVRSISDRDCTTGTARATARLPLYQRASRVDAAVAATSCGGLHIFSLPRDRKKIMGPHFTHMRMHPNVCADMRAEASVVYSTAAKAIELRVH